MTEDIQPEEFNLVRLPIPVPPMMETALGYGGDKQYVAFHECRISTEGLIVEDAAQIRPGVEPGWSLFRKHPAVARILEAAHLDLTRTLPRIAWGEWIALPRAEREQHLSKTRCLVLDRQTRRLYVGNYLNALIFLNVEADSTASELEDEDDISDDAGQASEGPRNDERSLSAPQPLEINRAVLEKLRHWLNENELVENDYSPEPAEGCGFRRTYISVAPGQIEDAFGYAGGRRYVSLHWSPKATQVFVCDGIGRWSFSNAVDTWNEFLNHPLVRPHLQRWDDSQKKSEQVDFSAHVTELPGSPLFSDESAAREMEADVKTNCILYDRADNELYVGDWSAAILFHSLVEDILEEDLVPDGRSKPMPLLAGLNARQEDPAHVFAVAASHNQHQQKDDALEALRHCIEKEPNSHLYWCRLSQTLGSLSRWDEALDAIDKAIAFHASAPRQYVTPGYMLKWKGNCLFWLGRYSEAAETFRFAIEIDEAGHKQDLYSQLARCYEKQGSYRDAIHARELQVRDSADSLAQAKKARESGEFDEEIVDSEEFFLSEAWFKLGRCYLLDGDFAAADWALRQAIGTGQQTVRPSAELGVLLRRLGRIDEGDCILREALALAITKIDENPKRGAAYGDLAFVYRALGQIDAAERFDRCAAELEWKSSEEDRRVVSSEAAERNAA